MHSLRMISLSVLVLINFCKPAFAADPVQLTGSPGEQMQQLNNQIQEQMKKNQATQSQQLEALNSQVQAQLKQIQSQLQDQIQKVNTQTQDQMKQMQATLQQQIKDVQEEARNNKF